MRINVFFINTKCKYCKSLEFTNRSSSDVGTLQTAKRKLRSSIILYDKKDFLYSVNEDSCNLARLCCKNKRTEKTRLGRVRETKNPGKRRLESLYFETRFTIFPLEFHEDNVSYFISFFTTSTLLIIQISHSKEYFAPKLLSPFKTR